MPATAETKHLGASTLADERSRSPRSSHLVIDKAAHFAWTDIGRTAFRGPIVDYSVAFMNRYVKGNPADRLLTQAAPGISLLRHPVKP
jgi:hypothetical protein